MHKQPTSLEVKRHTLCHKRFLSLLPSKFQSEDSNRLAIAYFSLSSLELLNQLTIFKVDELEEFKYYIYKHYIEDDQFAGFRGSLTYNESIRSIDLAATCFSLQCLLVLKDELKGVDVKKVMRFIQNCQMQNGGFTNNFLISNDDKDLRYCMIATTISKILLRDLHYIQDWINIPKLVTYISELQNYDGGFSMYQGDESHCGMVFCAINALSTIEYDFSSDEVKFDSLLNFLVHRQIYFNSFNEAELIENEYMDMDDNGGFNGRLNKYGDTCYVFWALSSLSLINKEDLIDQELALNFLLNKTQNSNMGGFNKTTDADELPDPLHSFLGLSALSILEYPMTGKINCNLVIPETSYTFWKNL